MSTHGKPGSSKHGDEELLDYSSVHILDSYNYHAHGQAITDIGLPAFSFTGNPSCMPAALNHDDQLFEAFELPINNHLYGMFSGPDLRTTDTNFEASVFPNFNSHITDENLSSLNPNETILDTSRLFNFDQPLLNESMAMIDMGTEQTGDTSGTLGAPMTHSEERLTQMDFGLLPNHAAATSSTSAGGTNLSFGGAYARNLCLCISNSIFGARL